MHDCQDGEEAAKWTMDHVPQIKDLPRSGEEQDALGDRRLPPRVVNRTLQFVIARRQNSKLGSIPAAPPSRAAKLPRFPSTTLNLAFRCPG
jgi:hypothetical protein